MNKHKSLATIISIAVFSLPFVSFAETSVSVQTQIDALLKQITQLQAQINTLRGLSPSSSESKCVDLSNALVIGSTDATTNGEVTKLQQFLILTGYFSGSSTGYYGTLTADAVVRYQKASGMDFVTAKSGVGPMTRGKMQCGNVSTQSSVQKITWVIEPANPNITDEHDYRKYEQKISVDVTKADTIMQRYNVGTAMGCTGSNTESMEGSKKILGKVTCYYALTGVGFVAYTQNGKFIVESQAESAKDGSITTTTVLTL